MTREDILWAILTERERQIEKEGFHELHDDTHENGELAAAAAAYANPCQIVIDGEGVRLEEIDLVGDDWEIPLPIGFPKDWNPGWWKPSGGPKRRLIKAAALIVAEIERLERLETKGDLK